VGVSLYGNRVLLGVTEGFVRHGALSHFASSVQFYLTIAAEKPEEAHHNHRAFSPSPIEKMLGRARFSGFRCEPFVHDRRGRMTGKSIYKAFPSPDDARQRAAGIP
jgi:hypothetical protein